MRDNIEKGHVALFFSDFQGQVDFISVIIMTLGVVYPHFNNLSWIKKSIRSHRINASDPIGVTVIDMSHTLEQHKKVREELKDYADVIGWLRLIPEKYYCGDTLTVSLSACATLANYDIVVLSDTDTLMLFGCWDRLITESLRTNHIVAINPRNDYPEFKNVVEWNWMAFKKGDVIAFLDDDGLHDHDWGHFVTRTTNGTIHLLPPLEHPCPRTLATICGWNGIPFVFHAFFATSKAGHDVYRTDAIELALTDEEIDTIENRFGLKQ